MSTTILFWNRQYGFCEKKCFSISRKSNVLPGIYYNTNNHHKASYLIYFSWQRYLRNIRFIFIFVLIGSLTLIACDYDTSTKEICKIKFPLLFKSYSCKEINQEPSFAISINYPLTEKPDDFQFFDEIFSHRHFIVTNRFCRI